MFRPPHASAPHRTARDDGALSADVRARWMSTCPNAWNSVSDNMTLNRGADERFVFNSHFSWPTEQAQGISNFTIEFVLEHHFVFNVSAGQPLTVHVVVPHQDYREDPALQNCSAHAFDALSGGAKSSLVTLANATVDGPASVSADFAVVAEITYDEMPTAAPTPAPSTASPTADPTRQPTASPSTAVPTAYPTSVPSAVPTSAPTAQPTAPPTAVPTTAVRCCQSPSRVWLNSACAHSYRPRFPARRPLHLRPLRPRPCPQRPRPPPRQRRCVVAS
jgi:hypothetical protein